MELISREDAIKCLDGNVLITEQKEAEAVKEYFEMVIARLKALPTIEERKEGEWIELQQNDDGTHNIQCSVCRICFKSKGHARSYYTRKHYAFCPHCGARMKGADDE